MVHSFTSHIVMPILIIIVEWFSWNDGFYNILFQTCNKFLIRDRFVVHGLPPRSLFFFLTSMSCWRHFHFSPEICIQITLCCLLAGDTKSLPLFCGFLWFACTHYGMETRLRVCLLSLWNMAWGTLEAMSSGLGWRSRVTKTKISDPVINGKPASCCKTCDAHRTPGRFPCLRTWICNPNHSTDLSFCSYSWSPSSM